VTTTTWLANRFDGQSSLARAVSLRIEQQTLLLDDHETGQSQDYPLGSLELSEAWAGAQRPIGLPDGATLWVRNGDTALDAALAAGGRRASWPAVVLAVVLLIAVALWFNLRGAGLVAGAVVDWLPRTADKAVGEQALKLLDKSWLLPSQLPETRREVLERRFAGHAKESGVGTQLLFRRTEKPQLNAFALPDGTIVLFDALVEQFTDDEVLAVLGHELGHVVHRHGMRKIASGLGIFATSSVLLGDYSSVAANSAAAVSSLRYSRKFESEADDYARAFIARAGLAPTVWQSVWQKFEAEERKSGADKIPAWLSTHPPTKERSCPAHEACQ